MRMLTPARASAQIAKNLGQTLRAFQPTIRELQQVSQDFKSALDQEARGGGTGVCVGCTESDSRPPAPVDRAGRPEVVCCRHAAPRPGQQADRGDAARFRGCRLGHCAAAGERRLRAGGRRRAGAGSTATASCCACGAAGCVEQAAGPLAAERLMPPLVTRFVRPAQTLLAPSVAMRPWWRQHRSTTRGNSCVPARR